MIQLVPLSFEERQLLQRPLAESAIDSVELRRTPKRIASLLLCGVQASIGQRRESGRAGFTIGERLQHPSCTGFPQIRHQTGQLDMRFLSQRFQLVL